jgi:hypothetical protein
LARSLQPAAGEASARAEAPRRLGHSQNPLPQARS